MSSKRIGILFILLSFLLPSQISAQVADNEKLKWLNEYPAVEAFIEGSNLESTIWFSPCPPPPPNQKSTQSCSIGVSGVPVVIPSSPINPCTKGMCGPGVGLEGTQKVLPSGQLMQFDQ
jgi:hypothetical protein